MIDRGRLGAEYSGVRRMKNGGAASSGTSLKDAYGQAASSMRAAGVTSVSGANTTQAAREAVSRAAATARSAPEVRTMAYDRGNMVQVREDDDRSAAASPAPAPAAAAPAPVSAASKGPVPVPPPRPTAQPGFFETLKSVPGAIARDVKMGYQAGLFRGRDTQRENLLEAGYTPAQIDDYFARTDATIARNEAEAAARSDRDDRGIMSLPGSPSATPVASAEELARLFSEGQDITGKTQADLQPLVEQFLRGRGITDFGTYMPKIFETLQVPLAPAVAPTPLPPAPVFVAPTNVMGSQPAAVAPNFVSPAPVTPAPVIPPFVPITPVGQTGAYSPPPFAPITRAEGGPVDKIPGVLYMQDGGLVVQKNADGTASILFPGGGIHTVSPTQGVDPVQALQQAYGGRISNVTSSGRTASELAAQQREVRAADEIATVAATLANQPKYGGGATTGFDPTQVGAYLGSMAGQLAAPETSADRYVTEAASQGANYLSRYLPPEQVSGMTQRQLLAANELMTQGGGVKSNNYLSNEDLDFILNKANDFQGAVWSPLGQAISLGAGSGEATRYTGPQVSGSAQAAAAQPAAASQPAAAASQTSFITPVGQAGPALPSPIPLPTITPVGQAAAYSPPPLPAAPSYGMTPSGQPAYSPYGQTLPFSFPQLSVPQLTPSFFQYLPPLPQNQPLV